MGTFKSVLITKQTNKYEYGFIFLLLITHLRNDSPQMRRRTEYIEYRLSGLAKLERHG